MPRSKVSIREAKLRYRLLRAVQRVLKTVLPTPLEAKLRYRLLLQELQRVQAEIRRMARRGREMRGW
jgi:hypothetical protein